MIESVAGFISAAPMPWTVRAAISDVASPASPHQSAPAEQVGQLPAREQEHAERQRVGVHDPLELRYGDAEVGADRRQRDVHHRVVEHDHEQAERDGDERPPLAVLVREHPCLHPSPLEVPRVRASGVSTPPPPAIAPFVSSSALT
jgi:hypothetical protein